MSSPPHDEPTDDTDDPVDDPNEPTAGRDDPGGETDDPSSTHDPGIGRRETRESGASSPVREDTRPGPRGDDPWTGTGGTESTGATGAATSQSTAEKDFDDPIGGLLPRASVDSRWWYWIAAIPLYVVLGGLLAILFVGAFLFDLFLTGGIATIFGAFIVVPVLGLLGLVLSIMYPIATYVDARAIAESDASWTPDPLVWGLAALATEVLSAFTLSVVLAIYYLYKRHVAVGTP
ncbi:hypothetical protein [Halobellus salinisoli]|uniref:hypothetical protein n=1 Tax=Halobellus salinisoli TaxID=3108500 RepID=UPI00300BF1BC